MKTVRREEPIVRNRFTECPHCKTRNFKIRKTISVGRCRSCRESYKIITLYLKIGGKTRTPARSDEEIKHKPQEPSQPSWQLSPDSSLFASTTQETSTFSNPNFAWSSEQQKDESETTSGQ